MAYVTKYRLYWGSTKTSGVIYIQKDNYSGAITDLSIYQKNVLVENDYENWDSHIIGKRATIDIQNNGDVYDLLDLMTATEREYKVVIDTITDEDGPHVERLFEGFIDSQQSEQLFAQFGVLKIVASSYLSKLEYSYPASFDTLQNLTFIDVIDEILTSIGVNFNICVNMVTRPAEYSIITNATALNLAGLYTEVFWENNVERKNSLEILKEILQTFNAYLYWYDSKWYIEEYHALWNSSKAYVEYTTGTSYDPSDSGSQTNESFPITDLHTLRFSELSQRLGTLPGNKQINIKLKLLALLNWTINDFSDIEDVATDYPAPDPRTWMAWNGNVNLFFIGGGAPYGNISNGIIRGITQTLEDYNEWHRGLYTCIKATVSEDSKLNIRYKYSFQSLEMGDSKYDFNGDWDLFKWTFHWYLRIEMPNGSGGTLDAMIGWDAGENRWEAYEVGSELFGGVYANEETVLQDLEVIGTEFDPDNKSYEINLNIPLGEIEFAGDLDTDWTMYFCIGVEEIQHGEDSGPVHASHGIASVATIGDANLSVSIDEDVDNLIEGAVNTNFLNKKEFELPLSDIPNLNYKNSIFTGDGAGGSDLNVRTTEWIRQTISPPEKPLVDWFMIDKFRIYNNTKQRIKSKVFSGKFLRLFSLFTESKQSNKKFVMMGLRHRVAEDIYEVKLEEYDNEEVVNLIES